MKHLIVLAVSLVGLLTACTQGAVEPNAVTYALDQVGNSGVVGSVTFEKATETTTTVTIDVEGTTTGMMHPAHIHVGDAADNGPIYISLEPVDGATGQSVTVISETDDGDPITYEELVNFDGYVNVHQSADDLATLLATGETGAGATTCKITIDCP